MYGTAPEVVRSFLAYDFDGYRLSSEGHSAIWELTKANGEPPETPVVVTRNYRVIREKTLPHGLCSVAIQFTVYGTIVEGDRGECSLRSPKYRTKLSKLGLTALTERAESILNLGISEYRHILERNPQNDGWTL